MLEFLSRLPLARFSIDRDDAARGSDRLWQDLFGDATTRVLYLHDGRTPCIRSGSGLVLALGRAHRPRVPLDEDRTVYLGRTLEPRRGGDPAGTRVVSYALTDAERATLDDTGHEWVALRDAALELDDVDAGLFTQAVAIDHWHASHRHAPETGEPTRPSRAGWVRRSTGGDGREMFPRTDAAVIAAITDDRDRLLLGANARWTPRRYSLLAGFVEPGESFEAAVAREVWEESGARVVRPRYLGSQPWPFPASIMVGFMGELDPDQDPDSIRPDRDEIADVRWFTRDDVRRDRHLLPPRISIARAIIEEWYGGTIDD